MQAWQLIGDDSFACLLALIAAALLTLVTTPVVRRVALHFRIVDKPGKRRVHARSTARLGGLAVLCGIIAGSIIGAQVAQTEVGGLAESVAFADMWPILGIGTVVCLLGALDDLHPISARGKLLGLTAASALLAVADITIEVVSVPGIGLLRLDQFAIPVTILWILACTNAVNLIDGVDGAGAGVVMIAASTLSLFALGLGDGVTAILFAATCGAAGGFLFHNKQPASIFLGDSGSLLFGFMLAATSTAGCTKNATAMIGVGALIALAVPFLDASQSFVRRFRLALGNGTLRQRFVAAIMATAVADMGHIHHRLLRRGLSHGRVALILCLVTTIAGVAVLLMLPSGAIHWSANLTMFSVGAFALYRLAAVKDRPANQHDAALLPKSTEMTSIIPTMPATAIGTTAKARRTASLVASSATVSAPRARLRPLARPDHLHQATNPQLRRPAPRPSPAPQQPMPPPQ